jgi:LAO/AO transport system kinase
VTEPVASLVDAATSGDRAALAKLLTIVENGGPAAHDVLAALHARPGERAAIVGVTGAPGAGKSTLTDRLVAHLRGEGAQVAVIAVDPTSPFTGGAILGDRVRMQEHDTDEGVFVRSMASRGELGGLSRAAPHAVRVLDAAGYSWVFVETVGVGQAEVAVAGTADTTIVVVTPGWGDAIQASKAGLLEVGDVFVVNKVDRGGVDSTVRDLEGTLTLGTRVSDDGGSPGWLPPIVQTVAIEDRGLDDLLAAIRAHRTHLEASGELDLRRERRVGDELRGIIIERLTKQVDDMCSGLLFGNLLRKVAAGTLDPYDAAAELVADQYEREGQRWESSG